MRLSRFASTPFRANSSPRAPSSPRRCTSSPTTLLAEFVAESGLQVLDFSDAAHRAEAARRMEKYRNVPMDYADATLVLLAERLDLFELLTLDRRGFSVFRSDRGKHFSLVLDRP